MSNLVIRTEFFLQSLFFRQASCPHCRSKDVYVVARKYGTIRVKRCQCCFLYFVSPIYRSWISRNFYQSLYSGEGLTTHPPKIEDLAYLKKNNFRGTDKDFNWLLQPMQNVVGPGARRLLEIGSSWGYFLFQAKKYGFKGVGIEIDSKRATFGKRCLGVDIVQSFDKLSEMEFDLIFSWHTLEHFTDLSGVFDQIRKRLRQNGHLVIAVPNFDYNRFKKRCLSIIGAVHPLGFSQEFFKRNLPRYGFSIRNFFARAVDFPHRPSDTSEEGGLMVWAQKTR